MGNEDFELFSSKLSYIGCSEQVSGIARRLVTAAISHRDYVKKKETKVWLEGILHN